MLFSELPKYCAHDLEGRRTVSKGTEGKYREVSRLLIEFFGDMHMETLTIIQLDDWQEWIDERGTAIETCNSYKRTCRTFWNRLTDRGIIAERLPKRFWNFRKARRKNKAASKNTAIKMLANSGIRDAAILFLAADSARRRGGLIDLNLNRLKMWFDEDDQEYRMVAKVTEKGEKPQLFLAGHEACTALISWLWIRGKLLNELGVDDHGFVFISLRTGQPLKANSLTHIAGKIKTKAYIAKEIPAGLHSFRHKRIKELIKKLDWATVRDIAGHEEVSTTMDIYGRNTDEELMLSFFGTGKW